MHATLTLVKQLHGVARCVPQQKPVALHFSQCHARRAKLASCVYSPSSRFRNGPLVRFSDIRRVQTIERHDHSVVSRRGQIDGVLRGFEWMVSVDLLPCAQHITARRGCSVTVAWDVFSESSQGEKSSGVVQHQRGGGVK